MTPPMPPRAVIFGREGVLANSKGPAFDPSEQDLVHPGPRNPDRRSDGRRVVTILRVPQ